MVREDRDLEDVGMQSIQASERKCSRRGYSKYKSPEVGTQLVCSSISRRPWLAMNRGDRTGTDRALEATVWTLAFTQR